MSDRPKSGLDRREPKWRESLRIRIAIPNARSVPIFADIIDALEDYDALAREHEELRAEIANFDAIRAQDRAVGMLLVELAGHLGMTCEVNSESILRRAIEYVRRGD